MWRKFRRNTNKTYNCGKNLTLSVTVVRINKFERTRSTYDVVCLAYLFDNIAVVSLFVAEPLGISIRQRVCQLSSRQIVTNFIKLRKLTHLV